MVLRQKQTPREFFITSTQSHYSSVPLLGHHTPAPTSWRYPSVLPAAAQSPYPPHRLPCCRLRTATEMLLRLLPAVSRRVIIVHRLAQVQQVVQSATVLPAAADEYRPGRAAATRCRQEEVAPVRQRHRARVLRSPPSAAPATSTAPSAAPPSPSALRAPNALRVFASPATTARRRARSASARRYSGAAQRPPAMRRRRDRPSGRRCARQQARLQAVQVTGVSSGDRGQRRHSQARGTCRCGCSTTGRPELALGPRITIVIVNRDMVPSLSARSAGKRWAGSPVLPFHIPTFRCHPISSPTTFISSVPCPGALNWLLAGRETVGPQLRSIVQPAARRGSTACDLSQRLKGETRHWSRKWHIVTM